MPDEMNQESSNIKRPGRGRKILIAAAAALLGLALALVLSLNAILNTPSSLRRMESLMGKYSGAAVRLEKVRVSGLRSVRLYGVRANWGPDRGITADIGVLNARFSLGRMLRGDYVPVKLSLAAPELSVRRDCSAQECTLSAIASDMGMRTDEKAAPGALAQSLERIPELRISRGALRLSFSYPAGRRTIALNDVRVDLGPQQGDTRRGRVEIKALRGDKLLVSNIRGEFSASGNALAIKGLKAELENGRLDVSGTFDFDPDTPDYDLRFGISGLQVDTLADRATGIPGLIRGRVNGAVSASGYTRNLLGTHVSFSLKSDSITLKIPLMPGATDSKDFLTISNAKLDIEGVRDGAGLVFRKAWLDTDWGSVRVTRGEFSIEDLLDRAAEPVVGFDFTVSLLFDDIRDLAERVPGFNPPLAGGASGNITFSGNTDHLSDIMADAELLLSKGKIFQSLGGGGGAIPFDRARAHVTYFKKQLQAAELTISGDAIDFEARGGIGADGSMDIRGRATFARAQAASIAGLGNLLAPVPDTDTSDVEAELKVGGATSMPRVRWRLNESWKQAHFLPVPVTPEIEPEPETSGKKKNAFEKVGSFFDKVF